MRCLVFVNLLLFVGCAGQYSIPGLEVDPCDFFVRPLPDSILVYNTIFRTGELSVSGIMLLHRDSIANLRFVMLAEAGPTLIDLYLTRNGYSKNFVYRKLDRVVILKLLHEDIGIATALFVDKNKGFKSNELNVCCYYVKKNLVLCYETDRNSGLPVKAVLTKKRKKKTTVNYYYSISSIPDSINVVHHRFNMQLTLYKNQ